MSELFKRIRGDSLLNILECFFIPKDVSTRRKEVGLLPAMYTRTKLRQKYLKVSILKIYNWLKGTSLLPQEVKNLSDRASSKHLHMMSHTYILNNKKLFNLFH